MSTPNRPSDGDKTALPLTPQVSELSRKDELELLEKRRQNQISLISIAVTFVVAIASLLWNASIQRQTTRTSNVLETTRVENGEVDSNSNGGDFKNPWRQWEQPISPTTVYLGIERVVPFERGFRTRPEVTLGLSLIDLAPMDVVLPRIGFRSNDPIMSERIRHLHVVTQIADITNDRFTIQLAVGLPTEAAKVLAVTLARSLDPNADQTFTDNMRRYRQLENRSDALNPGETWLINFYRTVGSFKITWIAQADEGSSEQKTTGVP